jgi:hypothetical protein
MRRALPIVFVAVLLTATVVDVVAAPDAIFITQRLSALT